MGWMDGWMASVEKEDMNHMDDYVLKSGNTLHLSLSGNPFVCNCDSLDFIEWLQNTEVKLDQEGNYSCKFVDNTRKTTKYVYDHLNRIKHMCLSKTWLNISIILGVIFILIFSATIIAYKYRITIHFWYLSIRRKYRHYTAMAGECNEFRYDAFIAYCQTDKEWICGTLINFLEVENDLKVCLHDRDFAIGKLIMDNIMDAISESRKTIIVVSHAFLESTWCEFELEMARMKMFQENRDMLVVILLDKLSVSRMPVSLMKIWNNITCLEVDEEIRCGQNNSYENLFWKRMYQAVVT